MFLGAHGAFLRAGDTLRWPALVKTLRAVAELGAEEFYSGETARKLVQDVQKQGSGQLPPSPAAAPASPLASPPAAFWIPGGGQVRPCARRLLPLWKQPLQAGALPWRCLQGSGPHPQAQLWWV